MMPMDVLTYAKNFGAEVCDGYYSMSEDELVDMVLTLQDKHDNIVAELEREIGMVRARVKRLEQENSWLEEANVRLMQTTNNQI